MIFVYLRDGRRVEIDQGEAFVRRGNLLVCLDGAGNEAVRFDCQEVTAYGHVPYPYDPDFVSRPLTAEEALPSPPRRRRGHQRLHRERRVADNE
ncbi:MAG TPA: hypothetical protein VNN10_02150 [Dehalococcoidia bacterium]|nr:hypothetical protein [Dehalococcoidia bacterium]